MLNLPALRCSLFGLLVVAGLASSPHLAAQQCRPELTSADVAGIKAVMEGYRTAWLKGDAAGVLDSFTDDGVLLPHRGGTPVMGRAAMQKYWFPAEATLAKVIKLNITFEQIGGDCQFAYARGRDEVGWTMEENGITKTYGNSGTYLNVFRKTPAGSWRITHHMWDDPATQQR